MRMGAGALAGLRCPCHMPQACPTCLYTSIHDSAPHILPPGPPAARPACLQGMNVPQIAAGRTCGTLRASNCLLLLRLLDDRGLVHFEEGTTLVKAVNVLMLKILETRWAAPLRRQPASSARAGHRLYHVLAGWRWHGRSIRALGDELSF